MPVAKLSREFYEKFGDKLTDELVSCLNAIEGAYRAELRDLFEAQLGRFDEKLERRLAEVKGELQAELHREISGVRGEIGGLRGEIGSLRSEFRGELMKWALGIWVLIALGVIGLYFKR